MVVALNDAGIISVGLSGGILALLIAAVFAYQVLQKDRGGPTMKRIGDIVHQGAKSFLHTEYMYLTLFVVVVAIAIGILVPRDQGKPRVQGKKQHWAKRVTQQHVPSLPTENLAGLFTAICFVVGAFLSASAGYAGMAMATSVSRLVVSQPCQALFC